MRTLAAPAKVDVTKKNELTHGIAIGKMKKVFVSLSILVCFSVFGQQFAKPQQAPNPKYDKVLSGALPPEELAIRDAWSDWEQQECTDKTLATDKKSLKVVQSARLNNLETLFKSIFKQPNDVQVVIAAKRYTDARIMRGKDETRYTFKTACLAKRGKIPEDASDLSTIKSLINLTAKAAVEVYDHPNSENLLKMRQYADNYKIRVAMTKIALKNIK